VVRVSGSRPEPVDRLTDRRQGVLVLGGRGESSGGDGASFRRTLKTKESAILRGYLLAHNGRETTFRRSVYGSCAFRLYLNASSLLSR
jgi:hypothetical protein